MRYIAIILLLILVWQKVRLRNILPSLAWNLNAAGYIVWAVYNLIATFSYGWLVAYWWVDWTLRIVGFVLLIAGAEVLIRDLRGLRSGRRR